MMQNTIQFLKQNGLFSRLVRKMQKDKHFTKEDLEDILDDICRQDEQFEDLFIYELHQVGVGIVWETLRNSLERERLDAMADPAELYKKARKGDLNKDVETMVKELTELVDFIKDKFLDDLK